MPFKENVYLQYMSASELNNKIIHSKYKYHNHKYKTGIGTVGTFSQLMDVDRMLFKSWAMTRVFNYTNKQQVFIIPYTSC